MSSIIIKSLFLSTTALLFFSTTHLKAEKTEKISTKTAVTFNTLCAKCHEGECSGRLSFDTGSEAAHSHIKRYAADSNITENDIKEFFTFLNYMKKECRLLMPGKGKLKMEDLSRFATPSRQAYFIPLGLLKKGSYELTLLTKEEHHYRLEILSDRFDPLLDLFICPDRQEKILFTVDTPVKSFVRIRSKKPLHILTLEIAATAEK